MSFFRSLCTILLMISIVLSSTAHAQVDTILDTINEHVEDLDNYNDDVQDAEDEEDLEDIYDDVENIADDIQDELSRLPVPIDEIERQNLVKNGENIKTWLDDMVEVLEALDEVEDDAIDEFRDDIEDLADDLINTIQFRIQTHSSSSIYNFENHNFDKINKLQDIVDDVEEIHDDIIDDSSISESELGDYFDDLEDEIKNFEDELSGIQTNSSSVFQMCQAAYNDLDDEVKDAINEIEDNLASDALKDEFDDLEDDLDDDLDDLRTSLNNILGSDVVKDLVYSESYEDAIEEFEDIEEDLEDIEEDIDDSSTITSAIILDDFLEDIQDEVENTEDQIDDLDELYIHEVQSIEDAFDSIEDAVKDALDALDGKINTTSLQTTFDDEEEEIIDDLDDIQEDIDRIPLKRDGSTSGKKLSTVELENIMYFIDEETEDIEDIEKSARKLSTISTEKVIEDFKDDIVDALESIESRIDILDGRIDSNQKNDLLNTIQDVVNASEDAIDEVKDNVISGLDDEADDAEEDVEEAAEQLEDAVDFLSEFQVRTFPDIGSNVFRNFIENIASAGVINGYPDGDFRPNKSVSRAEFLKMALNAANRSVSNESLPSIVDIDSSHSLSDYVAYAVNNNILEVDNRSGGKYFDPNTPISRIDAAKVLIRIKNINTVNPARSRFSDISNDEAEWADTAYQYGIFDGYPDGSFGPNNALTRGAAAKIIANSFGY